MQGVFAHISRVRRFKLSLDMVEGLNMSKERMLKYYVPPHGFEEDAAFTDSGEVFEALWQKWLNMKLYLMAKGTPLPEKGGRKADFAKAAEIFYNGVPVKN